MAAERMITRTIQKKVYHALVYRTIVGEGEDHTAEMDFILTEKVADDNAALILLRKRYESDAQKVCAILSTKIEEKRYGMSEVDFLKYAHILSKEEEEESKDSEA